MTRLQSGEIHIWTWRLDSIVDLSVLSAEETARAARLRSPVDRSRFQTGRATLRQLLGTYRGEAPSAFKFRYGPHGKPFLAGGPEFNLSHSNDWAACAIASEQPVGIDIEKRAEIPEAKWIMHNYFVEPGNATEFLERWTRAEALRKATGGGLNSVPFDRSVAGWSAMNVPLVEGFVGAIASHGQIAVVHRGIWEGLVPVEVAIQDQWTASPKSNPAYSPTQSAHAT